MFGSVSEWFYKALAGIQPAPDAVGFDQILIRPQPVGDLRWVRARHHSVRGEIVSAWERNAGTLALEVRIPANAQALVHIPTSDPSRVMESGRPVARSAGVTFVGADRGASVFRIGSGHYKFTAPDEAPR